MKNYLIILILLSAGCQTPYYTSINEMGGQPATLVLLSGQKLTGKIQIRSFDNYSSVRSVSFAEGVSKEYKSFYLTDIDYLFYNGSNYSVKTIKGSDMWGGAALRFIKELTAATGKLQLFENEIITKDKDGKVLKETRLLIQLPGNKREVYDAQGDKFIPNFDDKVAAYLRDCPKLVSFIRNKDKDFFYAFVNQGETRRKQVWMNIVNEYNNCK